MLSAATWLQREAHDQAIKSYLLYSNVRRFGKVGAWLESLSLADRERLATLKSDDLRKTRPDELYTWPTQEKL